MPALTDSCQESKFRKTINQREEKGMSTEIVAPMPGTIIDILVKPGEEVLEYQEVVILEAMKMENAIPTPEAGKVKEIKVKVDDKVSTNQVLIVLE
jgi:biotin carboxyl carrier protein